MSGMPKTFDEMATVERERLLVAPPIVMPPGMGYRPEGRTSTDYFDKDGQLASAVPASQDEIRALVEVFNKEMAALELEKKQVYVAPGFPGYTMPVSLLPYIPERRPFAEVFKDLVSATEAKASATAQSSASKDD
jgi:hypothetical protein